MELLPILRLYLELVAHRDGLQGDLLLPALQPLKLGQLLIKGKTSRLKKSRLVLLRYCKSLCQLYPLSQFPARLLNSMQLIRLVRNLREHFWPVEILVIPIWAETQEGWLRNRHPFVRRLLHYQLHPPQEQSVSLLLQPRIQKLFRRLLTLPAARPRLTSSPQRSCHSSPLRLHQRQDSDFHHQDYLVQGLGFLVILPFRRTRRAALLARGVGGASG